MKRIPVSACLMGRPVRHDGSARTLFDDGLEAWRAEGRLVSFCREVADVHGADVTEAFVTAADLTVAEARHRGCHWTRLTDGGPSCGSSFVYSGRFDGTRRDGRGVVAEALMACGIAVFVPPEIALLATAVESGT